MHEAHDALLCIAEGRTLSEQDRRRVTPEHWFKPAADMRTLFADLPEACDNTLAIARRCAVMAETRKPLLPVCPKVRPGQTEEETVRAMAMEGLERRMDAMARRRRHPRNLPRAAGIRARRHRHMGFSGYFLIVADFIQWSKAQGIPVGPGRGSGAGSVAAWALTITDLDPLRFNLLFERFLNPERVSMPDFDIDFCQEGRDRVIDYVRNEYGGDRVAQIITFGKLQARAAVRDVGRVLGLSVRPGQQSRRTDPEQSRQAGHAAAGGGRRTAPASAARRGRRHRPPAGNRPARRGPVSPCLHPCRRRRHRRSPAGRTGAALPRSEIRLPGHPILDEACRAGRSGQIRLPRPDHADHPAPRRKLPERPRHRGRSGPPAAGRHENLRDAAEEAMPAGCSRWKARACATRCGRCAPTGSRT